MKIGVSDLAVNASDAIPTFLPDEVNLHFENRYRREAEPYYYNERGIEFVRYDFFEAQIKRLNPEKEPMLDLGCSQGQLTSYLIPLTKNLVALDLSPTAVTRARQNCLKYPGGDQVKFICGSSLSLPFADNQFKIVVMSDGIDSWELDPEIKLKAMAEVARVLKPGGYAILSDYMKPKYFKSHRQLIEKANLPIKETFYLTDRLGFQITNNFWKYKNNKVISKILASKKIMKWTTILTKPFGALAAKHIAFILIKNTTTKA